jgi:shikimate dehydrogenase
MRLFVIGHPIAHSISPAIHTAALRACGIDGSYEALDVAPDQVGQTMDMLRQPGIGGCNVTLPHKQVVLPYLDDLSHEAARIEAVNTIAHIGERLIGHNTDASGFLASLAEHGVSAATERAVLLGAGGAARAIAFGLVRAGVTSLAICNRDVARGVSLAGAVALAAGPHQRIEGCPLTADSLSRLLADASLVVNATTVGMDAHASPVPAELLRPDSVVCDIIYNPAETPLLRDARRVGAQAINGLGMLVHQAAEAFSLWTGRQAPLAVMYEAASEALERRKAHT